MSGKTASNDDAGRRRPVAVVLVDGEHYPPVVTQAVRLLNERVDVRAAVFLGGREKLDGQVGGSPASGRAEIVESTVYGVPVVIGVDMVAALEHALTVYEPGVVVDASDEPVLGYQERFQLVSYALARNVAYEGSDFRFTPPRLERLSSRPCISVIGTGKRVGKTAVSGFLARTVRESLEAHPWGEIRTGAAGPGVTAEPQPSSGPPVVVVAMGRGGPEDPEVIDGRERRLGAAELIAHARAGRHAASDHFEDAVLSGVVTVGCRRCGGGMAGQPLVSNVAAGARVAEALGPQLVVFEGSGAAIPPVETDTRLLVAGAAQPQQYVTGLLGTYRMLLSDAMVLAMAEPPLASRESVARVIEEVGRIKPACKVIPIGFRPHPVESVDGKRVGVFTTAPKGSEAVLTEHLEERCGCRVEGFYTTLADREALRRDLSDPALRDAEVFLTEIKAAAIDVVAEEAEERGVEVVFMDNLPHEIHPARPGDLRETCLWLAELARQRFQER